VGDAWQRGGKGWDHGTSLQRALVACPVASPLHPFPALHTQPTKAEKEPLRPYYQRYHDLKAMITTLELALGAADSGSGIGGDGEGKSAGSGRGRPGACVPDGQRGGWGLVDG